MESFDTILEQYKPMIHKIINSLNIYKNKDEFYQIGIIALWEAFKKFEEKNGSFTGYAFTTIRGRILTELTRHSKENISTVNPSEEYWNAIEDESPFSPLEDEIILSYCKGLTESQTKWVVYSFINMMTIQEISHMEQVSISAVKKWRRGALEKLRQ